MIFSSNYLGIDGVFMFLRRFFILITIFFSFSELSYAGNKAQISCNYEKIAKLVTKNLERGYCESFIAYQETLFQKIHMKNVLRRAEKGCVKKFFKCELDKSKTSNGGYYIDGFYAGQSYEACYTPKDDTNADSIIDNEKSDLCKSISNCSNDSVRHRGNDKKTHRYNALFNKLGC